MPLEKTKNVFIIGNGFDLDLGLNTRYSNFADSDFWKFEHVDCSLLQFLKKIKGEFKENWFDIETLLKLYAQNTNENGYVDIYKDDQLISRFYPTENPEGDKLGYDELVSQMTKFINDAEEKASINENSCAVKLFKVIAHSNSFEPIYSFNYTDLNKLAKRLKIVDEINSIYVHGSVDSGPILGIEDSADVRNGYSYLYKTFNGHYRSNHLKYDLDEAKLVVFFGHSLGSADYHYFETFFKNQCNPDMDESQKVKIVLITFDDKSRRGMLGQLREMNNKRTDYLFSLNDLEILCTSKDKDRTRLENLIQEIKSELSVPES